MEIFADNKKYRFSEEAPIGCNDCRGCDKCCKGMGNTIVQDPYDLWMFSSNMRLEGGGKITFEALISEDGPWELSVHDGVILPNIKMVEDGRCPFLNEQGRCSIHPYRSGLCRLFPLAREYRIKNDESIGNIESCDDRVVYGVLGHEMGCDKILSKVASLGGTSPDNAGDASIFVPIGNKIKISEWLGIPRIRKYETFLMDWHKLKKAVAKDSNPNQQAEFLRIFYEKPYGDDFYLEFNERLNAFSK